MRFIVLGLIGLLGCASAPSGSDAPDDAAIVRDAAADVSTANVTDVAADAPVTAADAPATPSSYEAVHALLERSCAGYCHAGGIAVGTSLILAPHDGTGPALLGRSSRQVSRMMIVAPGDPGASYLMRKIDGTMGEVPECAARPTRCGNSMPSVPRDGVPVVSLSAEERDVIRRWIAEGAPGLTAP